MKIVDGLLYLLMVGAFASLTFPRSTRTCGAPILETVVPGHAYFVLGDHRNLSNDSRDFLGPVDEDYHLRQGRLRLLAFRQAGQAALTILLT